MATKSEPPRSTARRGSYAFSQPAGFHTGLTAVATDSQGLQTSTPTNFDLTTGVTGEPYKTVQDNYDANANFLGQTFFKPSGVVFLKSTYKALPNGESSYIYKGGSFFDGKDFTSFTDTVSANGDLETHIEFNKDGSHYQEIDANKQTVTALGTDSFVDNAAKTTFVFNPGFGQDAIYGFKATGADHDTLQISSGAGSLAQVLSSATSDGQGGTLLHLGATDTIDLVNITKAELKAHHGDFVVGAGDDGVSEAAGSLFLLRPGGRLATRRRRGSRRILSQPSVDDSSRVSA